MTTSSRYIAQAILNPGTGRYVGLIGEDEDSYNSTNGFYEIFVFPTQQQLDEFLRVITTLYGKLYNNAIGYNHVWSQISESDLQELKEFLEDIDSTNIKIGDERDAERFIEQETEALKEKEEMEEDLWMTLKKTNIRILSLS